MSKNGRVAWDEPEEKGKSQDHAGPYKLRCKCGMTLKFFMCIFLVYHVMIYFLKLFWIL